MHVVIFEGSRWPNLAPLSLTKPVFLLECGIGTLLDKQIRSLRPTRLTLWVRPGLADLVRRDVVPHTGVPTAVNEPLDDDPAVLVSGRSLFLAPYETGGGDDYVVLDDEDAIVREARVRAPGLSPQDAMRRTDRWARLIDDLPHTMSQARIVRYPWDLVAWNEEALVADAIHAHPAHRPPPPGPWHLVREEDVHLDDGVRLAPGAVLDASKGAVVVGKGASVGANAVLEGPCYVGPGAAVRPLTLVRHGTSVGTFAKVGGEVSNSVVGSYSNKAHDGYLGDSVVGSWVNLGAGTTTSNLKNTYGLITMKVGPTREVPTERRFLGSVFGDHSKTAVGTRLTTGTYVGCCTSLACPAPPPRFVPSFIFWTDKGADRHRLDKARETAAAVYARRHRSWAEADDKLLAYAMETAEAVER